MTLRSENPSPPEGLRIDPVDLEALRKGGNGREGLSRVFDACFEWVRARWERASDVDRHDLVVEAINHELDSLRDPDREAAAVSEALADTLDDLLAERLRQEHELLSKFDFSQFDQSISSAFALALARIVKNEVESALGLLEPPDRDILIDYHDLYKLGFLVSDPQSLEFANIAERRKACLRAHREFVRTLEAVVHGVVLALNNDRQVVEESLTMIRGEVAIITLAALSSLDFGGAT